jgi:hypothetical protein
MDVISIADAIEQLAGAHGAKGQLSTGVVTAMSGGRASVRRIGATVAEEEIVCLIARPPVVGDRVALTAIGGTTVIAGVLVSSLSPLDLKAPLVGQIYTLPFSSSSATAATNTSNATYATLRSVAWSSSEIPDGTYDLVVEWDAQFSDSAGGSLNFRPTVNGVVDTVQTLSVGTARERLGYIREFDAQVVSGGLTVLIEYKRDSGSGTASARNPRMLVFATRKGA